MTNFDSAFIAVTHLVNDFRANEKHFVSQSYSEADVRNDFINKFFIALGWDVRHEEQKNPYEQEVRVEKPLLIAKAQKRADYSFALAPNYRTVKFFVEAKKPAHDLSSKDYYFQTARYGWNAHTPVAILTDFEELHFVECRFKPNIDDALTYKIKQFHYSDYADKEKFAEIYWLFSREAVASGSIEKYNESLAKPKGKKAKLTKAVLQSIDEAFLGELDEIRTNLAKSFKKNNEHLSSEELTEATQRTIDRLVFIKFLEDKLIEPDHYVSQFGRRKSAWEDFLTDSRKLDAKYNGVVFKKSLIDSRNLIEPDVKTFSAICDELSHENTPYNFDAIPIHILGSIYERFLGKVVHATEKRVTIEEKPEVRKAGGVYYTPQYIVDYIVENTVGKLIDGKTPKQISKMCFADIACGSGSFLITVFETLLDYHKQYYQNNPEQAKKDGCILYEGAYRLSLKQKQEILTNNIYGVDIDQQAVEVTQLSLYLKLLEDETTATANDTWVLFKEQLLPDLNKNIVCGNSLIGTDILNPTSFLPFSKGEDEGGVGVDELKLKPMDFEKVFPEVMTAGGFDAIVGNPPWGAELNKDLIRYFEKKYNSFEYQLNSFSFFIEKALNLLKYEGRFGYIIPAVLLNQHYFKNIRSLIIDRNNLEQVILFKYQVFHRVSTGDTSILIINKRRLNKEPSQQTNYAIINNRIEFPKELIHKSISDFVSDDRKRILLDFNYTMLAKIKNNSYNLAEIANAVMGIKPYQVGKGKPKQNRKIVEERVYDSDIKKSHEYKQYLVGKDFDRYIIYSTIPKHIKYGIWLAEPRFGAPFEKRKIIVRQTSDIIRATIDENNYYNLNNVYNIELMNDTYDLNYLLGILNSKLLNYIYQSIVQERKRLFAEIKKVNLDQLLIRKIDFDNSMEKVNYNKILVLVNQMLEAKKQLQQAKTESDKNYLTRKCEQLDKEIDQLIYQLYGLTEEEIKIVEGK